MSRAADVLTVLVFVAAAVAIIAGLVDVATDPASCFGTCR
jgi:hypothetical protein